MDTGEYDGDYAQAIQAYNIQKARNMVYIQSDSERKLPHHFDAACAMYGAMDSCVEFRLTTFEEVKSGKFNNLIKSSLFVGSTEFMTEVFSKVSKYNQLPNANRPYETTNIKAVRDLVANGGKIFVKPIQIKLFTGFVADVSTIHSLDSYPDDQKVITYEVLPKIHSEWRVYVLRHQIEDARNYSGNFKLSPDYNYVEEVISENKKLGFPVAYTIDIGICEDELYMGRVQYFKSVVIEFNDMWAIGNYGVENWRYYNMLRERYFEIIRSPLKTMLVE